MAYPSGRKWARATTINSSDGAINKQRDSSSVRDEMDQMDNIIGSFGRYQLMIFLFKCLIGATSAFTNLGVTFFAPTSFIGYSCATVSPTMGTQATDSGGIGEIFGQFFYGEERRIRHGSPNFNYDTPAQNMTRSCTFTGYHYGNTAPQKCTSYRYDTGIWISTIIDEWDLVCDRAWYTSLIQSLYMSGFLLSFLLFGYLSDRYGRWRSLMLGASIEILSGFGCALSTSVTMFMVFRFLLGLGNAGRSSSSYLHLLEWAGPRWRVYASILGSLGWVAGYCAVPWVSLYFLHFRHVQLFICFYELVFVAWLLCLPETPRWLLIHKRFDEARGVLLRAAKFNGLIIEGSEQAADESRPRSSSAAEQQVALVDSRIVRSYGMPAHHHLELTKIDHYDKEPEAARVLDELAEGEDGAAAPLQPYTLDEFNEKFEKLVHAVQRKDFALNENKLNYIDLFRWQNIRKYALILCFVYAANSFIYYGIALGVGDFGGNNLFVAFTVAGLTELPSMAFAIVCMKLLPRKTANLIILMITGLMCALQIPLKYYNVRWAQQPTMMLAKLFNSSSFEVVRYQIMELFPTSIRHIAYSSCCLAGRIGSILAPFIKELTRMTNSYVPVAIYACLCFVSSILFTGIPETKGCPLPDTLLEAENQGKNKTKGRRVSATSLNHPC